MADVPWMSPALDALSAHADDPEAVAGLQEREALSLVDWIQRQPFATGVVYVAFVRHRCFRELDVGFPPIRCPSAKSFPRIRTYDNTQDWQTAALAPEPGQ